MTGLVNWLGQLEARCERYWTIIAELQALVGNLASQLHALQGNGSGSGQGSGAIVYFINPVVIAAGSSVTGVTIYTNIGGTLTASGTTNATVYNEMASATVSTSGKVIIVGANPDGSYSVVTQSC